MDQRTVSSVIAGRPVAGAPGGRIRSTNPARLDDVVADVALGDAALLVTALREDEKVLLLPCGPQSIRFRPALTIEEDDLTRGLKALDRCLTRIPVPS